MLRDRRADRRGRGLRRDTAHRLLAQTQATAAECLVDPEDDLGIGTRPLPRAAPRRRRAPHRPAGAGLARRGRAWCARGYDRQARLLGADAPRAGHHRPPRLRLLLPDGRPGRRRRKGDGHPGRRARLRRRVPGQPPAGIAHADPVEHGLLDGALPVQAAGRAARHRHRRGVRPPAGGLPRDHRPLRRRAGRDRRHAGDLPGPARHPRRGRRPVHGPGRDRPARQGLPAHPGPRRPRRAGGTARTARRVAGEKERYGRLWELVEALDALPRGIAMHPCGVLLSDASLLRPYAGRADQRRGPPHVAVRQGGRGGPRAAQAGCAGRADAVGDGARGRRGRAGHGRSGRPGRACRRATRRRTG